MQPFVTHSKRCLSSVPDSSPKRLLRLSRLLVSCVVMAPKKEFEPKPSSKQEKNKPKGGKAKDEKRAADKVKQAAKTAALFGK